MFKIHQKLFFENELDHKYYCELALKTAQYTRFILKSAGLLEKDKESGMEQGDLPKDKPIETNREDIKTAEKPEPAEETTEKKQKNSPENKTVEPVEKNRDDNEKNETEQTNSTMTEAETSTINLKELLGVGKAQKLTYSRTDLMNLAGNASSKTRPSCLLKEFDGMNGRWDPETWHRLTTGISLSTYSSGDNSYRPSTTKGTDDSKYQSDNIPGITLRPQRSFRDGCHVSNTSATTRTSKSYSFNETVTNTERGGARTRGSLRSRSDLGSTDTAKSGENESFEWERERRDRFRDSSNGFLTGRGRGAGNGRRDFDSDYRENDFRDRPSYQSTRSNFLSRRSESYANHNSSSTRHQSRMRSYSEHEHEEEPEWFSEGPTSQFDTIELGGFEDESWVGKEIPTDDLDLKEPEKVKETSDKQKETETPKSEVTKSKNEKKASTETTPPADAKEINKQQNDKPEESEQKAKDVEMKNDSQANPDKNENGSTSRFSRWFQQNNESGAESPSQEEVSKLTEQSATMEEDPEKMLNHFGLNNLLQNQPQDDAADATSLLMHQLNMNKARNAFQEKSDPTKTGAEYTNEDVLQKLVATLREKDKLKRQSEMHLQHGTPNNQPVTGGLTSSQMEALYPVLMQAKTEEEIYRMSAMLDANGQRIPSPEQLAAHTQNIFQKALLKKQLEKQKDVYKDKLRMMEQHRREEQLREAIRSVNEKMYESKQYQKNLAFTPTSVIRKMHESQGDKSTNPYSQDGMINPTSSEAIESATASLAAKLASITKKPTQIAQNASSSNSDSELLARIYQSAAVPQKQNAQQQQDQWIQQTDGNQRPTSFNQALNSNNKNLADIYQGQGKDKRNMQSLKHPVNYHQHMQNQIPQQQNNVAADFYNNNLKQKDEDKAASELRHQEVAQLTANVLSEAGISEKELSSLTVEQQQQVIKIVQQRYHQLQRQKQLLQNKKNQKAQMENMMKSSGDDFDKKTSTESGNENILDERKKFSDLQEKQLNEFKSVRSQQNASGVQQRLQQHVQATSIVPPPLAPMPNMFTPIPRGSVVPTAFIPPPYHSQVPPPNALPLGAPHPAAVLHLQQLYAQQAAAAHQQRVMAAALQQQQIQAIQAQVYAARKHPQVKTGNDGGSAFTNPLEKWFGPDVLTQSQTAAMHKHALNMSDLERVRQNTSNE